MSDVSVVIATYRRREACRRAIASVLAQTVPVREILVCDDGSDDGTVEMVVRWSAEEPRLRHVAAPGHAGRPAPARNRGIQAAQGEWVAFLDDDDTWTSDRLERQLAWAPVADVVCANARTAGGRVYFDDWQVPRTFGAATVRRTNPVILSTALVRRERLLDVGGFPEEAWLAGTEDYALWLQLAVVGARFVVLPDTLAVYDDAGATRLSRRVVANQVAVARFLWHLAAEHPADGALRRAALSKSSYALSLALGELRSRPRRIS
jgi:succinoglycan biosynthesis protein ExoO